MKNKTLKISLIQMIDKHLKGNPFTLRKILQESYTKYGFLSYTRVPAVYETKKSSSIEETFKLVKDGYYVQEDLGSFLFHAIINYD